MSLGPRSARLRAAPVALGAVALAGAVVYGAGVPHNPPGFDLDESSVAYNAYTIANSGRDEHGVSWPLYFRAFGEYKNPVYIYLLAAVFRAVGPTIATARWLSAALGAAAVLLIAVLAYRLSARAVVAVVITASALLTPWLFEVSRLVYEVAAYPLCVALLLVCVQAAQARERWSYGDALRVAGALALVTYGYSIGRLLGPLLAAGLITFAEQRHRRGVIATWLVFVVALLPLAVYHVLHPGALTARFASISYVDTRDPLGSAARFARLYARNVGPHGLLLWGDANPRHHVPVAGELLVGTALLAAIGVAIMLVQHRRSAWSRYVLFGLAVAPVPAALTDEGGFHALRLVAFPVFALACAVPAAQWLWREGASVPLRFARVAVLILTAAQGVLFHRGFAVARDHPTRTAAFDAPYPAAFRRAMARPERPVFLSEEDGGYYVHAYWYAALHGADTLEFRRVPVGARVPAEGQLLRYSPRPWSGTDWLASFRSPIAAIW